MIDPQQVAKPPGDSHESKKKAWKSFAYHAIVPLFGWFSDNDICVATADCTEDPVLHITATLWGGWDPAGVTSVDVNSKFKSACILFSL